MPQNHLDNHENNEGSPIAEAIEKSLQNITISTSPVAICGVNRKVNLGNYETLDLYSGVAIPVTEEILDNIGIIEDAIREVISHGFKISSSETFERFTLIKEMLTADANPPQQEDTKTT